MSKTFNFDGKIYDAEVSYEDNCDGCSFKRDHNEPRHEGCHLSPNCSGFIWLERTTEAAPTEHLVALNAALAGSKPSNPKDAIGIRRAPLSVLPMGVVAEMGVGLLEGASKYGRHNYRAVGVRGSVYFDATMRHLISWWEGEDTDPDSGMSHITKALCSLAVLRDAQMQGMCTDDRPPRAAPFYAALNELSGDIVDRHAGKSPRHYTIEDTL